MYVSKSKHVKVNAVPIVLPIGEEDNFKGIVDLVKIKRLYGMKIRWDATFDVVDIPEEMKMK